MSTVATLIEELRAAFPAKRVGRYSASDSTLGDEPFMVRREFADKDDWTVLDQKWLDEVPKGLGSALSFFSDEAICFYIPAFLAAEVAGQLTKADPIFALVHGFDVDSRDRRIGPNHPQTWSAYGRQRWARLTPSQVLAIIHCLEWIVESDGLWLRRDVVEALSAYWYPRAAETDRTDANL